MVTHSDSLRETRSGSLINFRLVIHWDSLKEIHWDSLMLTVINLVILMGSRLETLTVTLIDSHLETLMGSHWETLKLTAKVTDSLKVIPMETRLPIHLEIPRLILINFQKVIRMHLDLVTVTLMVILTDFPT